jgi:hypothetical protein
MKVGNLVRRCHYGAPSKGWGPVGIIVGSAFATDYWIVEWAADGKRETIRKEHIQLVY